MQCAQDVPCGILVVRSNTSFCTQLHALTNAGQDGTIGIYCTPDDHMHAYV